MGVLDQRVDLAHVGIDPNSGGVKGFAPDSGAQACNVRADLDVDHVPQRRGSNMEP
jgi:hypothetical protein